MKLSIIVPAWNEAAGIAATLQALAPLRASGHEVIVVDGGSSDGTPQIAMPFADRVLDAPRGRARQMNAGAAAAGGDVLLFLHADTLLPPRADERIERGLGERCWGRFDVRIEGGIALCVVAWMMNWRSRLSGIATGDQAIFVRRTAFESIGGYPDLPLMEDIEASARLKKLSPPTCIASRAVTSGRRWQRHGVLRTILRMWRVRLAYFLGARPDELARKYANGG